MNLGLSEIFCWDVVPTVGEVSATSRTVEFLDRVIEALTAVAVECGEDGIAPLLRAECETLKLVSYELRDLIAVCDGAQDMYLKVQDDVQARRRQKNALDDHQ